MDFDALAGAATRLVVDRCRATLARPANVPVEADPVGGESAAGPGAVAGDGARPAAGHGGGDAINEAAAGSTVTATAADGNGVPNPGDAAARRVFALVGQKVQGTYFGDVLTRLCQQPDDADLAQALQAALRELLRSDGRFARSVGQEVERAHTAPPTAPPPSASPPADELMADQTSDASGNTVTIGTMKGSQLALGSIVNNRKVQVSLGLGLPLLVLLIVLFLLRGSGDESPARAEDGDTDRHEDVAEQRSSNDDEDVADEDTTTTTASNPSPGQVAWRWAPAEPLSGYEHVSFGDYTVIADHETGQLLVYDRVTGEELDARPLGGVADLTVVPYGTGDDWAMAAYSEREVPANGLDPARVERSVELFPDPAEPAVYSAELDENENSYFSGSAHVVVNASSERSDMTAYSVETGERLWSSVQFSTADSSATPSPVGRTTISAFDVDSAITGTLRHAILTDTTGDVLVEIPEDTGLVLAEPGTDVWQGWGQQPTPDGSTVPYYFVVQDGRRGPNIPDPDMYAHTSVEVEAATGILVLVFPDRLEGYDSTTGEHVWSTPATFGGGVQDGLIHLRQDGLVVLRANDQLVVVDTATGEQVWTSGPDRPPEDQLDLVYDTSDDFYDGGPTISGPANDAGLVFWYVGDQLPVARDGETVLLAP